MDDDIIGKLCVIHIPCGYLGTRRGVCLYDDVGASGARLMEGDIVVPLVCAPSFCYYILTQHGIGRLEDEFFKEV